MREGTLCERYYDLPHADVWRISDSKSWPLALRELPAEAPPESKRFLGWTTERHWLLGERTAGEGRAG